MATNQELFGQITQTLQAAQQSLNSDASTAYQTLDHQIRQLENVARENFQAKLKNDYQTVVEKLEKGTPLTTDERQILELLIVGEANYYLRHENDFGNWLNELRRISAEIERLQAGGLTKIAEVMHLQALCRDARGILPDIMFYLREKERVERFKSGTQGEISPADGKMLANMIRAMMASPDM